MYRTILLLMIFSLALTAKADIIMEGTVYKTITFTNLNDYPEYDFCITYQTFKYNRGYQPAGEVTVTVKQGEQYQPPRGSEATVIAKHKTSGTEIKGNQLVGGIEYDTRRLTVLDKVAIKKITEREVILEIIYDNAAGDNTLKKNGLEMLGWWGVIPISAFALGLLIWQIRRRQSTAQKLSA